MPLRSQLFAASSALQSCLVSDAAHVTPGAKGEHVALIQSALVRLRFLTRDDASSESRHFGPKTAAAVLDYKQVNRIINRRYQTHADNIVGKMRIASLDQAILVLDGGSDRFPRGVAPAGPHPQSPSKPSPTTGPGRAPVSPAGRTFSLVGGPSGGGLETLPADMQETIRRSNAGKVPNTLMLFPFIAGHEGPLSETELSARIAASDNAQSKAHLLELHARMRPFDIWKNIRVIISVYQGTGSRGIFCEPFEHNTFLRLMFALTTGPRTSPDPDVVPLSVPLSDSRFCKDAFNVHGERDSFREIVKHGPGLHICIAKPAVRSTLDCDLHIDAVQQGQVCSRGVCIPLINGQTIEHLRTVGPWLIKKAKSTVFGE